MRNTSTGVVFLLVLAVLPRPPVAAQEVPPAECGGAVLEWAGSDGHLPGADGGFTPVLMVHGITGSDDMWRQWIEGSISPYGVPVERSVFEQINRIPGAVAYTFDYHDDSLKWVDAPEVGGRLGEAIDCLYEAFEQKVVVIAHSMGGLATKWVANSDGPLGPRSTKIGLVVALGTPFEGSDVLAFGKGVLAAANLLSSGMSYVALQLLDVLLMICGEQATTDADACGILGVPESAAGQALEAGSSQIAALGSWPDEIQVVAHGGSILIHDLGSLGIFYTTTEWDTIDLGDIAVMSSSAVAGTDRSKLRTCDYTMSVTNSAVDNVLSYFDLVPLHERDNLLGFFWNSPCYHSNLATTIEIHVDVLGTVNDYLTEVHQLPPPEIFAGTPAELAVEFVRRAFDGSNYVSLILQQVYIDPDGNTAPNDPGPLIDFIGSLVAGFAPPFDISNWEAGSPYLLEELGPGCQYEGDFHVGCDVAIAAGGSPVVVAHVSITSVDGVMGVDGLWMAGGSPINYRTPLTIYGLGSIAAGGTFLEAQSATAQLFAFSGYDAMEGRCFFASIDGFDGLFFQAFGDRDWIPPIQATVAAVVVTDSRFSTPSGLHVGSTYEQVMAALGPQLSETAHEYVEGSYLDFNPRDAAEQHLSMRFVIVDGVVVEIRAGLRDATTLVEGCA